MLRITFSDISIRVIKSTFKMRFILAKICRKAPPLARIVDKLFFEGDDILVLPRDSTVKSNKSRSTAAVSEIEINADMEVPREETILPSQVLKEMIRKSRYHFIMDFFYNGLLYM